MNEFHKFDTRESWLHKAVSLMVPLFEAHGYKIPPIRVSCGWPHSGGTKKNKRTIGQCWAGEASSDGHPQIFISPWLDLPADPMGVLATLVHEVVHATVGNKEKHGKVFGKCARAVGLEGKLTATVAGAELTVKMLIWLEELGKYPHAKLDLLKSPVKKQSTRMIKMECPECGYVCRTSMKWINEVGPAHCPVHGQMTYTFSELEEEAEK